MVVLYNDKAECSGCGACKEICPQKAIAMEPDEDGFLYPIIQQSKCIECKLCIKVCDIKKVDRERKPLATFAAIHKDRERIRESSSGGVFVALADYILENGGVVFGCAYNEDFQPEHIGIDDKKEIHKLQGSKYVQSDVKDTFLEAKTYLEEGRKVLYTGTPCQIAGLTGFLGKEYENLITADLICHGVPSPKFFRGYLKYLENKKKARVICYKFRDKDRSGMGCIGSVVYQKRAKIIRKPVHFSLDYYYNYFMYGHIYRESCYQCKYASSNRKGDFSLGDYWGIEEAHPEVDIQNGVSVILVNSEKGMELLKNLELQLYDSTWEKACKKNGNLRESTRRSEKRDVILRTYRDCGADFVARGFKKEIRGKWVVYRVKTMVPRNIKKRIRNIIN